MFYKLILKYCIIKFDFSQLLFISHTIFGLIIFPVFFRTKKDKSAFSRCYREVGILRNAFLLNDPVDAAGSVLKFRTV